MHCPDRGAHHFLPLFAALLGLADPGLGHAQATAGEGTQSFVACPVYRDTDQGRKSGCWLADDPETHQRYDITWAPIKPQLGKPVLVEGVVTDEPDTCGGVVLKPIEVSVLPGRCPSEVVPAGAYPGRPSPPPVAVLRPASEPRSLPDPPYEERAFHIYFEFGRDFLRYQHAEVVLEQVQLFVQASAARRLRIDAFAATAPVVHSGRRLAEPLWLAGARADMVLLALKRLGIAEDLIEINTYGTPESTMLHDGQLPEFSKRRVTITVLP